MNALVTGANGFIGRKLCADLRAHGADVWEQDLNVGDLTNADALDAYPPCDVVFHLAALAFVPQSWETTHRYFQTNLMGTVTVLEYCRKHHAKLVMMSTYVYGEPRYLPVDEAHPTCAVSPYHESKLMCEELCRFYHEQFGIDAVILRPFNIYGPGQNSMFLLPKVMEQVLDPKKEAVEVFDLSPKRDYIYVDDVVRAIGMSERCPEGLHTLNIGTGISISVAEAIEKIMRVTGIRKPILETQQKRVSEISDCRADITLVHRMLGYQPRYGFEDGIRQWLNAMADVTG